MTKAHSPGLLELPAEIIEKILTAVVAKNSDGPLAFVTFGLVHSTLAEVCRNNQILLKVAIQQRPILLIRAQVKHNMRKAQQDLEERIAIFSSAIDRLKNA